MPGVAWDLLPMTRYRAHNWHCFGDLEREPYAAIYTTLGCPYHCSFCCIQAPFKAGEQVLGLQRRASTATASGARRGSIEEIDLLVSKYGVRNIKFADEMFVLNQRHVIGICDLLIERGYDLNIWAYARVDTVKDGMLDKLKRAGFNWLALGIEAADDRVLTDVDKRYEVDEVYDTVRQHQGRRHQHHRQLHLRPAGRHARDACSATLDLALDLNCEFANFYSAMAYPGSPLYDEAVRRGWRLPDTWSGYSQHAVDTLPLPTRHISAGEVLRFRDRAFDTYFTHEPYLTDGQREIRRGHPRAHPRDDVAQAGEEVRTKLSIAIEQAETRYHASSLGSFGTQASATSRSLPARPCTGAAPRGRRTEPSFCW